MTTSLQRCGSCGKRQATLADGWWICAGCGYKAAGTEALPPVPRKRGRPPGPATVRREPPKPIRSDPTVPAVFGKPNGKDHRPVRYLRIEDVVCGTLNVSVEELLSTCRNKRVVLARELILILVREMSPLSYPEAAKAMGRPNHSSVITMHKRGLRSLGMPLAERLLNDPIVSVLGADTVGALLARLRGKVRSP